MPIGWANLTAIIDTNVLVWAAGIRADTRAGLQRDSDRRGPHHNASAGRPWTVARSHHRTAPHAAVIRRLGQDTQAWLGEDPPFETNQGGGLRCHAQAEP